MVLTTDSHFSPILPSFGIDLFPLFSFLFFNSFSFFLIRYRHRCRRSRFFFHWRCQKFCCLVFTSENLCRSIGQDLIELQTLPQG